ncbi:MAG: hypothetical protein RLZZ450_4382 [Pseudomonadota bacterium]
MRSIDHRYQDPLDLIWLACARELDIEVVRSSEVYASFDGARVLTLSSHQHFDADDSLAQLIFHELCHGLVAGERGQRKVDWGMENIDQRDLTQEHACHRVQAALADRHGLRAFFAVTTDHRAYWDALPIDPLGPGEDLAIPFAREAFERAAEGRWAGPLQRALARTAALAETMRSLELPADSLWRRTRSLHASGFPLGDDQHDTCGECAWGHGRVDDLRCRQLTSTRNDRRRGPRRGKLTASLPGCVRFEPKLVAASCASCGACCREGFDRVELTQREHTRRASEGLLRLVVVDGFGPHVPRPGGLCVALDRRAATLPAPSYTCAIYPERPQACADFAVGGDACLTARRRVGLSV